MKQSTSQTVFISAITSDIGIALAHYYARDGYAVCGTYRNRDGIDQLADIPGCRMFFCDLLDLDSVRHSILEFRRLQISWDVFISCAGLPQPLCGFFESDFEEWNRSVQVNALGQLRMLHGLYPFRNMSEIAQAVFFAGPGTNSAVRNFSAMAVSKLMLIKMCELLNAEDESLNIFIIGPGWTRTKMHSLIVNDPQVSREKYMETSSFINSGTGTDMKNIYQSIQWLCAQGKSVSGGRNFSVVHDQWGKETLADALSNDPDMYKLRRFRNEWTPKTE